MILSTHYVAHVDQATELGIWVPPTLSSGHIPTSSMGRKGTDTTNPFETSQVTDIEAVHLDTYIRNRPKEVQRIASEEWAMLFRATESQGEKMSPPPSAPSTVTRPGPPPDHRPQYLIPAPPPSQWPWGSLSFSSFF